MLAGSDVTDLFWMVFPSLIVASPGRPVLSAVHPAGREVDNACVAVREPTWQAGVVAVGGIVHGIVKSKATLGIRKHFRREPLEYASSVMRGCAVTRPWGRRYDRVGVERRHRRVVLHAADG